MLTPNWALAFNFLSSREKEIIKKFAQWELLQLSHVQQNQFSPTLLQVFLLIHVLPKNTFFHKLQIYFLSTQVFSYEVCNNYLTRISYIYEAPDEKFKTNSNSPLYNFPKKNLANWTKQMPQIAKVLWIIRIIKTFSFMKLLRLTFALGITKTTRIPEINESHEKSGPWIE